MTSLNSLSQMASVNSSTYGGSTSGSTSSTTTASTSASSAVTAQLSKVYDRLSAQVKSESASLSLLGQYKSALSDIDSAGQALSGLQGSASADTVVATLQNFVTAYNAALTQGGKVNSSGKGGATGSAQTLGDLRRALGKADTATLSLGKLGLVRQPDGSLKLNADALRKTWASQSAGVTSALQAMGKSLSQAANNALTSSGRLASAISQSGQRVQSLSSQQDTVLELGTGTDASGNSSATSSTSATSDPLLSAGSTSGVSSLAAQMGLSAYLSNS